MNKSNLNIPFSFSDNVTYIFRFLEDHYGYHAKVINKNLACYESDFIVINFSYDEFSFEIDVKFHIKEFKEKISFQLPDIIASLSIDEELGNQGFFQAADTQIVKRCLSKIARVFTEYCSLLLKGDKSTIRKIYIATLEKNKRVTDEYTIRPVKLKAEEAWRNKDFEKVKELYDSISNHLTELEKKKFIYAYKQASQKKE